MKKYKWHPLILVKNLIILSLVLFLIWFAASYVDIIIHNLTPGHSYADWNMLIMVLKASL